MANIIRYCLYVKTKKKKYKQTYLQIENKDYVLRELAAQIKGWLRNQK